jgi:EF hand
MKKRLSWIAGVLFACGLAVGAAAVAQEQPPDSPKIEAAGKQWLALMNKDNDNTVDKKEFLNYMEKEFSEADTDHDGTLDVRELGRLRMKLSVH